MHDADTGRRANFADWRRPGWILLSVVQLCVYAAAAVIFFHWAPWVSAKPISDLRPEVAATLPAGCPAVFSDHGTYHCVWEGTIAENAKRFAAETLLFAACVIFVIGSGKAAQRRADARNRDAHRPA